MANPIFNMVRVRKVLGGRDILKDISLSFLPGAKIGIIGPNGSGKSTLMRIMAGIDTDFSGEAFAAPHVKVGYLAQDPKLNPESTVLEVVQEAFGEIQALIKKYEELNLRLCEPLDDKEMDKVLNESSRVQDEIEAKDGWDVDRKLDIAMEALGCPDKDQKIAVLSGGEKRRVALCRLLLSAPDLLLLDEPTNHLDAQSVEWLENHLKNYPGSVIIITHDRYFLDNITEWILELDGGHGVPWHTNYSKWLESKLEKLVLKEKQETARQKTLQREKDWIQNHKHKSSWRVSAYQDLLNQEKSTNVGLKEIPFPIPPRLGDKVMEAKDLTKSYGQRNLFKNLSFRLPPGGIVGIIGPNGAGKTTLFRMMIEEEAIDNGSLEIGSSVKISYVDQLLKNLDLEKTVYEELSSGKEYFSLGQSDVSVRAYISQFGFKGQDQQKKIKVLSGGEKHRLYLAKSIMNGGNVLLLDEPTNDLDIDTVRALEDGLLNFSGCAVIISHDRWFLDRVATHILSFEKDNVVWFEGNYHEYRENKLQRLGKEGDKPHKKLMHHA
jgi:sulfate-transporting ATPase